MVLCMISFYQLFFIKKNMKTNKSKSQEMASVHIYL